MLEEDKEKNLSEGEDLKNTSIETVNIRARAYE